MGVPRVLTCGVRCGFGVCVRAYGLRAAVYTHAWLATDACACRHGVHVCCVPGVAGGASAARGFMFVVCPTRYRMETAARTPDWVRKYVLAA
jgi:hypothetical protein